MMQRVPEPELMDDFEQARAYALADFSEPHSHFIELFKEKFPGEITGVALEPGCGTGDISQRFAEAFPSSRIHAFDGAEQMLMFARQRVDAARLHEQIRLFCRLLPTDNMPLEQYDVIFSNSLLHHLSEPQVLWQAVKQFTRPGSRVFVMDLMRCASSDEAARLVEEYSANEPEVLKRDFYHSLHAAFTPDEVSEQLRVAGLDSLKVEVVSDRHLIIYGQI